MRSAVCAFFHSLGIMGLIITFVAGSNNRFGIIKFHFFCFGGLVVLLHFSFLLHPFYTQTGILFTFRNMPYAMADKLPGLFAQCLWLLSRFGKPKHIARAVVTGFAVQATVAFRDPGPAV